MTVPQAESSAEHSIYVDSLQAAQLAELIYVDEQQPCFRRQRRGKGFTYRQQSGDCVRDAALLARIKALVIPPGWKDVWICADPNGHIQATGRDEQGRKQYIYHPRWEAVRNLAKFNRMLAFAETLPMIREQVALDLQARILSRQKVVAIVMRLLDETLIRIGNREYVRQNNSYGLTTLRDKHLKLSTQGAQLKFKGKSGVEQAIPIEDKQLLRLIKKCQELPGQQLFQYLDENGQRQSVQSNDVNHYLRALTGQDYSAKDFRTWGGTRAAIRALYLLGPAPTARVCKLNISQAIKQAAHELGNTVTVCRKYYVHPQILAAYEDNTLFMAMQRAAEAYTPSPTGLDIEELAVVSILRSPDTSQPRQPAPHLS